MADQNAGALLRPLGFGEIFDRAVTLYVRNFVPFSLILLALMVPNALAQYAFQAEQLNRLGGILSGAAAAPAGPFAMYETSSFGFALLFGLIFAVLLPFALNAVALGVARIYTGGTVDVRACYARAFREFWPTIGMLVMDFLILVGAYAALMLVAGIGFGLGIVIAGIGRWFGVFVFAATAVVVLAIVALMAMFFIALAFAMFALIIEDAPVFEAIGRGFRRVFERREMGRAALFALALFAIVVLNLIVTYAVMGLALYLHQPWLVTLENVVLSTIVNAFFTILLVVYYYDVRIRHEGFDLEAQLVALNAAPDA